MSDQDCFIFVKSFLSSLEKGNNPQEKGMHFKEGYNLNLKAAVFVFLFAWVFCLFFIYLFIIRMHNGGKEAEAKSQSVLIHSEGFL